VAGTDSGYYTGYISVFDKEEKLQLEYFPRNEKLLGTLKQTKDLQNLVLFSRQFYTIGRWHDTLTFNDLRFGQVLGWRYPKNQFAFHYFLEYPRHNALVVQRGRFAGWNWQEIKYFAARIKGN
jgi:inner membrane protein